MRDNSDIIGTDVPYTERELIQRALWLACLPRRRADDSLMPMSA